MSHLTYAEAGVVGLLQGITELFPVSSLGHAVLIPALAQTFTRGCLSVLVVVIAFDVIGTGEAGVGVLTAAVGAGAIAGSLGTLALIGGKHLAVWRECAPWTSRTSWPDCASMKPP